MAVLLGVEDGLRLLLSESSRSRSLGDVSEAADRALVLVRQLQQEYSASLRRQREGQSVAFPSSSVHHKQDMLRPLLLACNHLTAGPKTHIIALSTIQLLVELDGVNLSDGLNVVHVLQIQMSNRSVEVKLRALQTLLSLMLWCMPTMDQEMLMQSLHICLQLHTSANQMVRNASLAALRQIVLNTFNMNIPDFKFQSEEQPDIDNAPTMHAAALFRDLCVTCTDGLIVMFRRYPIPKMMCLQLLELILTFKPSVVSHTTGMLDLVKEELVPTLLDILVRPMEYPFQCLVSCASAC